MPKLAEQLADAINAYCQANGCGVYTRVVKVEAEYNNLPRQMRVYHGGQMILANVPANTDLETRKQAIYKALDEIHPIHVPAGIENTREVFDSLPEKATAPIQTRRVGRPKKESVVG